MKVMKAARIFPALIIAALACLPLAAAQDYGEIVVPPASTYISVSSGGWVSFGEGGTEISVPISFQAGYLVNNGRGSAAIGIGSRVDTAFGVGSNDLLTIAGLVGVDSHFRINRVLSVEAMGGVAFAVDDYWAGIGPGALVSARLTPPGFSGVSIDFGVSGYGLFGDRDRFALQPFVSFTLLTGDPFLMTYALLAADTIIY